MIGAFGTVTKGLLKGLDDLEVGGRVETIQTSELFERPEYWEESWRLEETCCHSNSCERPSANADVKNTQGINDKNNELCKKLKFDYTNKWYMHKPDSIPEDSLRFWDTNRLTNPRQKTRPRDKKKAELAE